MAKKQDLFKNLACLSFCLFSLFLASIFVSETYFNRIINDQIQELSLLKSVHYQDWGVLSSPSPVTHKFRPYTYDQNGNSSLVNQSIEYEHIFKYENFSFTQGNTGNVRYLNNWKMVPVEKTIRDSNETKINVFNVEAEKVYNYDFYAPDVRRFALAYNIVFDMLAKEFVPLFYGQYMYEYIFKNPSMVQARIFDPLRIKKDDGDKIYSHSMYGLNTAQKIAKWLKLGDQVEDGKIYTSEFYQGVVNELKLTEQQILYIAGPRSSMQGLLNAIKGAVTAKIGEIDGDFCDDDDFCSNQKLVAAQLSIGLLTKQPIFPSVMIGKPINELNVTLFDSIQYKTFCENRPDLKNCSGDSNSDALGFFGKNFLSNFTQVAYIFKNLDKANAIQEAYDIPEAGQAMIEYIKFLYTNSFNLFSENSFKENVNSNEYSEMQVQLPKSSQQQTKSLKISTLEENVNAQAFKRSFTNYNHIQPVLDRFETLLSVELYSRAFYNNFISKAKPKCEDYYTEDFQANKEDCQKLPLAELADVRVYMTAFLGIDSTLFMENTTIQGHQIYQFFHNSEKSLFAKQANQLASDIQKQYNCTSFCKKQELFYLQWKTGSVLTNLPSPKYFANKEDSIKNWDQENLLKGVQPQLYKFVTVSQQVDPSLILNSKTGIYSLFNLMKIYSNRDGTTYAGLTNSDLLYYLQTLVMEVEFQGIYVEQSASEFFNTHYSQIIDQKRNMDPQLGGAPWLSPNISVIKLENNPQTFNQINSGIYDSQKLRSFSMIEDNLYSSSVYQAYKSDWENVAVTFTSSNKIKGTNLFGFQTKIQEHDSIEGYFDMIYRAQALNYKNTVEWKDSNNGEITAFRFELDGAKKYDVTVEQLTNKTIELTTDTYFIVEPNTGLTLQMYIKYTVYSKPFYVDYLQRGNQTSKSFPLYQCQISYKNPNTSKIVQISKDEHTLNTLFILGIVLSSVFMVAFVVFLVLHRKSRKHNLFREQNKSLMSGEVSSGVGESFQ